MTTIGSYKYRVRMELHDVYNIGLTFRAFNDFVKLMKEMDLNSDLSLYPVYYVIQGFSSEYQILQVLNYIRMARSTSDNFNELFGEPVIEYAEPHSNKWVSALAAVMADDLKRMEDI